MAEAHALGPHHEVDHRAARLAGAETVPEILRRCYHERRLVVVVEGAEAKEVPAVRLEHHAARLGEPLDLVWRDAGHRETSVLRNPVKSRSGEITMLAIYYYL